MQDEQSITIQVKKGFKVNVREVEDLEEDRQIVAEAPPGLKIAVKQVGLSDARGSASKITMCG